VSCDVRTGLRVACNMGKLCADSVLFILCWQCSVLDGRRLCMMYGSVNCTVCVCEVYYSLSLQYYIYFTDCHLHFTANVGCLVPTNSSAKQLSVHNYTVVSALCPQLKFINKCSCIICMPVLVSSQLYCTLHTSLFIDYTNLTVKFLQYSTWSPC